MSCKRCISLNYHHKRRPEVVVTADELRIDGMLCQDLNKFKVTKRTGQIYCPPGAEHLFTHRFTVGQIIAIPSYTWLTTDGYESGSTTSDWMKRVKVVQLVRIKSEHRSGPMPGRAPFSAIHCDVEVLGTTKDDGLLEYCAYRGTAKSTATKLKIDRIKLYKPT